MNLAGQKNITGLYAALLAFALFLLFYNLGGRLLWSDEAETAMLAKSTLHHGYPRTTDGLNLITLYGSEVDGPDGAWTWSPWLQEYVAAGSFAVFGPSAWSARAPFALIAWLSLVLLARVTYKIYHDHRVALASVALLGTSEIFLLHARQCRYYSIPVFCEILLVYGIHQLLTRDRRCIATIAVALVLQFYSNYIVAAANVPALIWLAGIILWRKDETSLWLATSLGILLVAALPWMIYAQVWQQSDVIESNPPATKAWYYLTEFNFHFMPWPFLLLPFLPGIRRGSGSGENSGLARTAAAPEALLRWEKQLALLLLLYYCVLCFIPGSFVRYLLPVLPVACVLCAGWLFRYVRPRWVTYLVILVSCVSNAGSLAAAYPVRGNHTLRWPLAGFISGITERYDDRFTEVLRYLQKNTRPGQSVLTFDPEFALMFHSRLKVIDAMLNGNNVMTVDTLPDWILSESASGLMKVTPVAPPAEFADRYERLTLAVPDSTRSGVVPDPDVYQYHATTNRVPYILYRKRNAAAP